MSSIPTLDICELDSSLARGSQGDDAQALGRAFREYGFVSLTGHGIDAALVDPAYEAVRCFFALPEQAKRRYHLAGLSGARGYTPFGTEKAKDQPLPDLKEFWHVGRELSPDDAHYAKLTPNVWPDEVPALKPALLALYRALDALGARVLSLIALDLGLSPDWFAPHVDHGNSILRPLHYPPLGSSRDRDAHVAGVRSAAHEDINLITLMVASGEPGLEILRRDGQWLEVEVAPGQVVVNIGDMLQRLTNHVLPSTTHRVVNPPGEVGRRSRYSMPFFLHPNSDFVIESLPSCVSPAQPNRYPVPITADAYLRQRLSEIGLL